MDRDGPLMARHLELQIDITGPRHELSISRPSKEGMIRALDFHYFKSQCLSSRVMLISKSYLQSYLTNRICRFTGHHTMEDRIGRSKIFIS